MLTICHLDGERGFRGGERQLLYLAGSLRARGHRNIIVCRRKSPLSRAASTMGFETYHLPFLTEWDPLSAWLLRFKVKRERAILHAHTGHTAALAALSGGWGRAVVHRRVDFHLNGSLSRRLKYSSAGRVVAVSKAIRGILIGDGVLGDSIDVVPDGLPVNEKECGWARVPEGRFAEPLKRVRVDLRRKFAKEFEIDKSVPWIGNLAALVPHKDHDTLLATAICVLQKRPDVVFLIAGKGPEEARLIRQISRMGLAGKVHIIGHLEDPMPFLKSLDILAHSSWGEGMGSVLLEAAACGVPIAATNAGGIPEILSDGINGLLSPARDPESLAKNILRLLEDRALAKRLKDGAREGLERFGLERMAGEMERIYKRVSYDS